MFLHNFQGVGKFKNNVSLREWNKLKKKEPFHCQEDMDLVHHQLVEQIARISVDEEEERMRDELELNKEDGIN